MVWGSSSLRSCAPLLDKVERNQVEELVFLSTKNVTQSDWDRLIQAIRGGSTSLTSLAASGHAIDGATLRALGLAIRQAPRWKSLAVGDKDLGGNSGGLDELVVGLLGDDNDASALQLEALDLSYKGLTKSTHLLSIQKLTASCCHLKRLDLSRNPGVLNPLSGDRADDDNGSSSPPLFPYLQRLDVTACDVDGMSAQALFRNLPSCQMLNLSENPIGKQPFDVLGSSPSALLELQLAHCQLEDASITSLPTTSQPCSLKMLDLSNNHLTAVAMMTLAPWLASENASHLRQLNLADNPLTSGGVETLVQHGLVPRSEPLQSLDLSQTHCGTSGALAAVQATCVALSLRLFDNQLGSDGFNVLAPCLVGGHEGLQSLDLAGNGASEASVVHLLRGLLQKNKNEGSNTLVTVIVGGNKGGEELEKLVQELRTLRPEVDVARDRLRH